jgi:RNA polymerase sigma factor (sigma-70 family)
MAPVPDPRTDEELERLAASGDRDAFGVLYERHGARLYDYLLRLTRNADDAADLMQETFVRALGAMRPERAGAGRFSAWLFTIAHNAALTRLGRRSRVMPLAPAPDDAPAPDYEVSATVTPEAAAEAGELSALVWEAAQALEPRQYSLLHLHVREGLDSAEIAQVLGVSTGNAYTMLSRLRKSFESAVAGLVMSRRARGTCPELDRILDAHGPEPINVALRKRIDDHTARCETCRAERRRLVSAAAILRAVPILPMPLLVKERVAAAAADAICAHAASLTSGAISLAPEQGGAAWGALRSGARGSKAAAVAGVALFAALLLPGAARPEPARPVVAAIAGATATSGPLRAAPAATAPPQATATPGSLPGSAVLSAAARPAAAVAGVAAQPPPAAPVAATPVVSSPAQTATFTPAVTHTPAPPRRRDTQPSHAAADPTATPPLAATSTRTPPPEPTPTPTVTLPSPTRTSPPNATPTPCDTRHPRDHRRCHDGHDDDGDHDGDDDDDDRDDEQGRAT